MPSTSFITDVAASVSAGGSKGTGRSESAGFLKENYVDSLDDFVGKHNEVMKRLAKTRDVFGGGTLQGVYTMSSVRYILSPSSGLSTGERQILQNPQASRSLQPVLLARGMTSRIRTTLQVRLDTRGGNKGSWMEAERNEVEASMVTFENNFERKLILGNFDVCGELASESAATYTLYSQDDRDSTTAGTYKNGAMYLRDMIGAEFQVVDRASLGVPSPLGVAIGTTTLTSPDYAPAAGTSLVLSAEPNESSIAAPTCTFSTSVGGSATAFTSMTTTAADGVCLVPTLSRINTNATDSAAFDSLLLCINGLHSVVNDANGKNYYLGLARNASSRFLSATIMKASDNVPRNWDDQFIYKAQLGSQGFGRGDSANFILMNPATSIEFVNASTGNARMPPVLEERGYGKRIGIAAGDTVLPIVAARYMPQGSVWGIDESTMGWVAQTDLQKISNYNPGVHGRLENEQVWFKSGNFASDCPRNSFRVDDIKSKFLDIVT